MSMRPSRLVSETQIIPLPKGSTLLACPNQTSEIVAVEMYIPLGCREELSKQSGITTLGLRMLSRGTKQKSDYEIAVGLESLGASFSCETQQDRSVISIQTTRSFLKETFALVREVLLESIFPKEQFDTEKEIQVMEIMEDLDSPNTAAQRLFMDTLFEGHPYGLPRLGKVETVSSLIHHEVKDYISTRLGRSGISIGAAGHFDIPELVDILSDLVASLPSSNQTGVSRPENLVPLSETRITKLKRETEAECILYGFPIPGILDSEMPIWKVLDCIMGGSMDSRLFANVREKRGLVYQIGSSCPLLEWQGVFLINLITTYKNHDAVMECLNQEIQTLKETTPEIDEINRAKTYLKGIYTMRQERNSDQAALLARYHTLGLGLEHIDKYPEMIDQVSPEEIQQIATKNLREPVIAIVGPQ